MQCNGWVIYDQAVPKGVIAFLADLFTHQLPIQNYLEEEALAMA